MSKVLAPLRSLGVLLGVWSVLALVALVAGVLPPFGVGGEPADAEPEEDTAPTARTDHEERPDGGAPADARRAASEGTTDTTAPEAPRPRLTTSPYAICTGVTAPPFARALQVIGDARPELVVSCGSRAVVLSLASDRLAPTKVVELDAAPPAPVAAEGAPETPAPSNAIVGAVVAADVDGDSLPDLAIPVADAVEAAPRTSGVFLLRRQASGGFEPAFRLAPASAAVALAPAQVDARESTDLLVLTAGNVVGRRASDVWTFGGGAAPFRMGATRAAMGGTALASADVDRDGHEDAVVAAREGAGLVVLFGDGTGRFPRRADVALPGATEVATGDADGDGAADVIVRADGVYLVLGGPIESLVPREISASDLADIVLFDVDADRKREVVGIDGPRVVYVETGEDEIRDARVLVELVGGARPDRFALADFDADGKLDLVIVAAAGEATLLVSVPDVANVGVVAADATQVASVPDAPLVLTIPLR